MVSWDQYSSTVTSPPSIDTPHARTDNSETQVFDIRHSISLIEMARIARLVLFLTAVLIDQSRAHFLLNYPPTIGFHDSLEVSAPCGSFTVDFSKDNVTDFHVNGDSLAMTSIHPMATWLFRATLDQTAAGNWTDLLPAVVQTGLGDYCETNITVPATWAGSKGVIQVVQDAPDGILYQVSLPLLLIRFWLSFRGSKSLC